MSSSCTSATVPARSFDAGDQAAWHDSPYARVRLKDLEAQAAIDSAAIEQLKRELRVLVTLPAPEALLERARNLDAATGRSRGAVRLQCSLLTRSAARRLRAGSYRDASVRRGGLRVLRPRCFHIVVQRGCAGALRALEHDAGRPSRPRQRLGRVAPLATIRPPTRAAPSLASRAP